MTQTLAYGSLDEAETAYLMNAYDRVLDGWEYLGAGVHRSAYLSPSRVVYKVAHDGYSARQAQFAEMLAVRVLSTVPSPAGFGVPRADLVEVVPGIPVIAMEFIDGEGCYLDGDRQTTARSFYRNNDIHAGNIIERRSDGTIFMIDLGFFSEDDNGGDSYDAQCSCCRTCAYCGERGCEAECQFCGVCGERECVCCELCGQPTDGFAPFACDCCRDCGEREGDCVCDFCEVCTRHNDDCRGSNDCAPWDIA